MIKNLIILNYEFINSKIIFNLYSFKMDNQEEGKNKIIISNFESI
jgi:hypothetical protein